MLQFHGRQNEYEEMISWFSLLPMFIEGEGFRAVHACWDTKSIDYLKSISSDGLLSKNLLEQSTVTSSLLSNAVEVVCKGLEVKLPEGVSFHDKDGTKRHDIRVKWWEDPKGKNFKEMSVVKGLDMKSTSFDLPMNHYRPSEVPIFFGHYW